jgi:hypothetical protein
MFETIKGTAKQTPAQPIGGPIRYMHFRRPLFKFGRASMQMRSSNFGGITVAYRKTGEHQYKCAMARCSLKDKDRYDKPIGRKVAMRRLVEDDDVWTLDLAVGLDLRGQMLKLLTDLKEFRRALRPEIRK